MTVADICFEGVKENSSRSILKSDSQNVYFCRACLPSVVTREILLKGMCELPDSLKP